MNIRRAIQETVLEGQAVGPDRLTSFMPRPVRDMSNAIPDTRFHLRKSRWVGFDQFDIRRAPAFGHREPRGHESFDEFIRVNVV